MDPFVITLIAAVMAAGFLITAILAGFRIQAMKQALDRREAESGDLQSRLSECTRLLEARTHELMQASTEKASAESRLEQLASLREALESRSAEVATLKSTIGELEKQQAVMQTAVEKERQATEEKLAALREIQQQLPETFRSASAKAMRENSQSFMELAGATMTKYLTGAMGELDKRQQTIAETIKPVQTALERYEQQIRAMENAREKAYGGLKEQVKSLAAGQSALEKETGRLVQALRRPHVRGRWGEFTLRRVAEISGMTDRCDFTEQASVSTDSGALRPDMIIHLPGERQIVVDAKVPLNAYLEALEADGADARERLMDQHVKHIHNHIHQLSLKSYWRQFQPTPEFVVMFIPGENFFSAALLQDPLLIENATAKGVIPATPTTLISLLKTVAMGWRQEAMARNARAVSKLGTELYQRLSVMTRHLSALGKDIDRATRSYNDLVGSFERRVMPSARRFGELGIGSDTETLPEELSQAENRPRTITDDPETPQS